MPSLYQFTCRCSARHQRWTAKFCRARNQALKLCKIRRFLRQILQKLRARKDHWQRRDSNRPQAAALSRSHLPGQALASPQCRHTDTGDRSSAKDIAISAKRVAKRSARRIHATLGDDCHRQSGRAASGHADSPKYRCGRTGGGIVPTHRTGFFNRQRSTRHANW